MTIDSTTPRPGDLAGARRGPDRTARRGVGRGRAPAVRRRGEPPTRQRRRARPRRPPPRAGSGWPGHDRPPSRRVLRPPGPARPDRVRRGLPDRSVGRRGPGRLPHRARRRPADADPGVAAEGPRTGGGPPAAHPAQHRDQQPRQHRPPLRPVQRALRDLPRPDPELLLGALRHPGPRAPYGEHLVAIPPGGEAATEPLAEAQARKFERLLDRTGVGDGTRLLEIGTGWGELAIRAARRGAQVRTVTLSTEQLELARRRVAEAGVADRVQVDLLDYRAIQERAAYDAVVSRWR